MRAGEISKLCKNISNWENTLLNNLLHKFVAQLPSVALRTNNQRKQSEMCLNQPFALHLSPISISEEAVLMVAGTPLLALIPPGMQTAWGLKAVVVFPQQIPPVSHSTVLVQIKAQRVSGQDPKKYYSAKSVSIGGLSF